MSLYAVSDIEMVLGAITFFVLGWFVRWIVAKYEIVIRTRKPKEK